MKPQTTLLGLISLAALATTPALATVTKLASFEGGSNGGTFPTVDSSYAVTPDPVDGWYANSAHVTDGTWTNTDGVTDGNLAVTVNVAPAATGWCQALVYGDGNDLAVSSDTLSRMNAILIPALAAGQNTLAIDVGTYNVGFEKCTFISSTGAGTHGWFQFDDGVDGLSRVKISSNPDDVSVSTCYITFSTENSAIIQTNLNNRATANSYSGLNFYFNVTIADAETPASLYFDNVRVFDGIWEVAGENDSTWYGEMFAYQTGTGDIYSYDNMAYQYAVGTTPGSIWIYDYKLGWLWTRLNVYPYYYVVATGEWAYYFADYSVANSARTYYTWKADGSAQGWTSAASLATGVIDTPYVAQ